MLPDANCESLNTNSIPQPKNMWQHRPNLLSQLCVPRLPSFHTSTTDTGANTLNITTTVFVKLWNLQHVRPQPGGTYNMIKNFLVRLQRRRASRSV